MKRIVSVLLTTIILLSRPATALAGTDSGIGVMPREEAGSTTTFSSQADELNRELLPAEKLQSTQGFIGNFLSSLLPYLLTIGGLILLFMLISGGFAIMTAVDDPKKADAGKQQITQALIGFLLLFAAFWIAQILEVIFGIKFL